MAHFTHTKEGAIEALGLNNVNQVNRMIGLAEKKGILVSQFKGGIEYFDVDILERYGTKKQKKESIDYSIEYIEVEVTRRRRKKKIAEEPVEQFYDYSNRVQAVFLFD